ncbi:aldo/keto reductase [Saccharopolyspora hattusasensis]|uniref:aldo/keto reductase n=1 Tax=Saccharopolyspora hattusasensis TaxID=1128679 RepID=UPI003D984539
MTVSRIAFGTGQLGGIGGSSTSVPPTKRSGTRASSAPTCSTPRRPTGSGGSEEVLGTALRDEPTSDRDSLVIATKGGIDPGGGRPRDAGRAWLRQGIDESLRALRLDHVDLYRMHRPDPGTPAGETADALQELVDEGRHVGVSKYDAQQLAESDRFRPVKPAAALPPVPARDRAGDPALSPRARHRDARLQQAWPDRDLAFPGSFQADLPVSGEEHDHGQRPGGQHATAFA